MNKDRLPSQPNQSLIDGLKVLQILAMSRNPVRCKDLAEQTGMEMTRVNRLLKTLDYLGLAQSDKSRKYKVGPGIHVLASQSLFGSGLVRKSAKHLENLGKFGHIVAMGMLWHNQVSYLYFWFKGISSAEAIGRAEVLPATLSSLGLVLLSKKTDEEIASLYKGKTIPGFSGLPELLKRISTVRSAGYGEVVPSYRSLAVCVGDPPIAALSLAGKIGIREIPRYVEELKRVAELIDHDLKENEGQNEPKLPKRRRNNGDD